MYVIYFAFTYFLILPNIYPGNVDINPIPTVHAQMCKTKWYTLYLISHVIFENVNKPVFNNHQDNLKVRITDNFRISLYSFFLWL